MDWQDIATAPKDGTAIVLWIPVINRPVVGWNWANEWDGDALRAGEPTHWMPLPPAVRPVDAPQTPACEGTCNAFLAPCGAAFCTYEEMAQHACRHGDAQRDDPA